MDDDIFYIPKGNIVFQRVNNKDTLTNFNNKFYKKWLVDQMKIMKLLRILLKQKIFIAFIFSIVIKF